MSARDWLVTLLPILSDAEPAPNWVRTKRYTRARSTRLANVADAATKGAPKNTNNYAREGR